MTANYNGGFYFEAENIIGIGHTTVDASVGIDSAGRRYRLSVYAYNMFNQHYYVNGLTGSGLLRSVGAANPATYGVALDVKF